MIAVTGVHGQVGSAVARALGDDAIGLARADLDLCDVDAIRSVLERIRPSTIINCAAYTSVDQAEDNRDTARAVNATAVGVMARVANDLDARFATFSTDYVFDGEASTEYSESAATRPINVYGSTKAEGERLALDANPRSLIIRTSWILSGTHPGFLSTMIDLIGRGSVRVVDDQRGKPTMADDLAVAAVAALDSRATGILHLTNAEAMTWFDLAREIAAAAGLDPANVKRCTTADFPRLAERPMNSCLVSERLDEFGLLPMPSHRPALERAVSIIRESDR